MKIYSVSEFVDALKDYLEDGLGEISIQGEVADLKKAQERLVFFELKDATSRISCFMMAWELKTILEEGMEIRVYGRASLFKKSGKLHVRIREIELVGAGALTKALAVLKERLQKEGLFVEERKRALPRFPERIGLITSADAAAYTDVLRVMKNRWSGSRVRFVPSGVQGPGAIRQLVSALTYFNTEEHVDVIILTRGGGSLEDLQAFNAEDVARAIFASRTPVVVGVGHERDWTIADLVADRRASTPSNAAEMVVPERREVLYQIETLAGNIEDTYRTSLRDWHEYIERRIHSGEQLVRERTQRVLQASSKLIEAFGQFERQISTKITTSAMIIGQISDRFGFRIRSAIDALSAQLKLIRSLSPQHTLQRGYSITRHSGRVITNVHALRPGDKIQTRFARGETESTITTTRV